VSNKAWNLIFPRQEDFAYFSLLTPGGLISVAQTTDETTRECPATSRFDWRSVSLPEDNGGIEEYRHVLPLTRPRN